MLIAEALQSHGHRIKKQGRSWGGNWCPHCGEGSADSNRFCAWTGRDHKERWFCHACGARGDLADLISILDGVPLAQALKDARVSRPESARPAMKGEPPMSAGAHRADADAPIEAIKALLGRMLRTLPMWEPEVGAYLAMRGISKDVVVQAAHRGLVRMLPTNPMRARELYLHAAGGAQELVRLGFWAGNSDKWPANVFRPLLFFCGGLTTAEFRHIKPNSAYPKAIRQGVLTKPFVWRSERTDAVVVVEGVMDMLSLVQMGERRTIIALPGVNAWRLEWFIAAHRAYGSRFVLALDDDDAGNKMAEIIARALAEHGIESSRLLPQGAKDWNEMLLSN